MQLSITGHHIDVTEALHRYVTQKFVRLERHYDHITNVHAVLSVEKLIHKAEATVHTSGAELFADSVSEDMYAAIDALVDKLDRQVQKYKQKQQDHHRGEKPARLPAE
jgi:putative sigma-54 modulation protein